MFDPILLLLLASCASAAPGSLVNIAMNFNSLCKECQVHTAAVQDILLHAGNESDDSGLAAVVSLAIDYYGGWPTYVPNNDTCENNAIGLEHGPDRCVTDRYHLCAQHASPPEPHWFDYVQCMWMNIDTLKCHKNGFCAKRSDFFEALSRVHPMCAESAGVNGEAIQACAESSRAIELQKASYLRANKTLVHGFAPTYVDGIYLKEVPRWRLTVDMLSYGRKLLTTVCKIIASTGSKSANASSLPMGCRGLVDVAPVEHPPLAPPTPPTPLTSLASLASLTSLTPPPPARPTWPATFFVNFEEFWSGGGGDGREAGYALDMTYVDPATGIKGAQAVLRGPSEDFSCNAVNPGSKCVTLAVGGQRYLSFEDGPVTCCRCCSWGDGCGPLTPQWTENATYAGTKIVRGETCYDYNIVGNSNNSLSVRASDGALCALSNAGADFFEFIPSTFRHNVPNAEDLFKVPAGCNNTWCGAHGACKFGQP